MAKVRYFVHSHNLLLLPLIFIWLGTDKFHRLCPVQTRFQAFLAPSHRGRICRNTAKRRLFSTSHRLFYSFYVLCDPVGFAGSVTRPVDAVVLNEPEFLLLPRGHFLLLQPFCNVVMDPFTVVTGAAGLASLGITICNGILTYCQNYRSRGDDLMMLNQHAARLKTFLQLLEKRQQESTTLQPTLESSMQECLGACNLCMAEFNAFHDKYSQQPISHSLKDHGKSMVRKLQYPFERDKMELFRQQLHEFHFAISAQILFMN